MMLVVISALLAGIVGGLLPGIGSSMVLIVLLFWLNTLSVEHLILFYAVLVSTMQYYGSVSSILFGVMGEPTGSPAVLNGHELHIRGYGHFALRSAALGSFIAGLFGIVVLYILLHNSAFLASIMTGTLKVIVISSALLILVLMSKSYMLSVLFCVFGLLIGGAGNMDVPLLTYIFPRYTTFDGGIPMLPVLVGAVAIPILFQSWRSTAIQVVEPNFENNSIRIARIWPIIRGTVIGCICGIIPGVSYNISSNVAESFERMLNNASDDVKSLSDNLISAESANNSGAIVVLAPLLIWAVPIVPSESILLGILQQNGFSTNTPIQNIFSLWLLVAVLLITTVINYIFSGRLYKWLAVIFISINKYYYVSIIAFVTAIVMVTGWHEHEVLKTVVVYLISILMAVVIKNTKLIMVFVFSFYVSNQILPEIYRHILIYG